MGDIEIGERSVTARGSVAIGDVERSVAEHGSRLPFELADPTLSVADAARLGADVTGSGTLTSAILSLDIRTKDGDTFRAGPTSPKEFEAILRGGGSRATLYAELDRIRTRYERELRALALDLTERGGRSSLRPLLPSQGFDVGRALIGTVDLATILAATFAIEPPLALRSVVALGFPDIATAGDNVSFVRTHDPLAIDAIDERRVRGVRWSSGLERDVEALPAGSAWLLVVFGGETQGDVDERSTGLYEAYAARAEAPSFAAYSIAPRRDAGASACTRDVWFDTVCNPDMLGHYLRDLARLGAANGYAATFGGHFGRGRIHARFDFGGDAPQHERYRTFTIAVAETAHRFGATISLRDVALDQREEVREIAYGRTILAAVREFRAAWGASEAFEPVDAPHVRAFADVERVRDPPRLQAIEARPRASGFATALARVRRRK